MADDFGRKEEIELLMHEYVPLRAEIMEFVRHYRAHAKYLGVILTIIIALLSFAAKSDSGFFLFKSRLFWFFAGFSITTIVSYYVFDALEAQYAMFATSGRAAVLEDMINDRAGKKLLGWESGLSDRFWWGSRPYWWSSQSPLNGVKYPSQFLIFYMIVVLFLILSAVPFYCARTIMFNPAYQDHVTLGQAMISINALYALISFSCIIYVAPTVLWRMKGPANDLARRVAKEAQEQFERQRRAKK